MSHYCHCCLFNLNTSSTLTHMHREADILPNTCPLWERNKWCKNKASSASSITILWGSLYSLYACYTSLGELGASMCTTIQVQNNNYKHYKCVTEDVRYQHRSKGISNRYHCCLCSQVGNGDEMTMYAVIALSPTS